MKSLPDRLLAALDRRDIPEWVRVQVYNQVCGPAAEDPPKVAWRALRAEVKAHIASMRGNKGKAHPAMAELRAEYYDVVVSIHKAIRAYPTYVPIPEGRTRWQEWVPKEQRESLSARFRTEYRIQGLRGNRIVPFAPTQYRNENLERLRRCEAAIAAHRAHHDPMGIGKGATPLDALMLCACRMAERAIAQYRKDLDAGTVHPYETPAKVNWQHYCNAALRARVREAIAGQPVSLDGLESFYDVHEVA